MAPRINRVEKQVEDQGGGADCCAGQEKQGGGAARSCYNGVHGQERQCGRENSNPSTRIVSKGLCFYILMYSGCFFPGFLANEY